MNIPHLARPLIALALLASTALAAHADNARAEAAFAKNDYVTAWREWSAAANAGDADAQAALGSLLYQHKNPPGSGVYADAERWFRLSAEHNNGHGLLGLAYFYYDRAKQLNSGINPGHNDFVPPPRRQEAEGYLLKARTALERCVDLGNGYCMGNLATFLDAGLGGPKDPQRAALLRKGVAGRTNPQFTRAATEDPAKQAMLAQWQQGRYAEALATANRRAQAGDTGSLTLIGKAYYLGIGLPRDYAQALQYFSRGVARNDADAMYFLGLMYEHGRGVRQDLDRATSLLDRAAAMGQGYAQREVDGMRLQGESNRVTAMMRGHKGTDDVACETAGGISTPGACLRGGESIDPWAAGR